MCIRNPKVRIPCDSTIHHSNGHFSDSKNSEKLMKMIICQQRLRKRCISFQNIDEIHEFQSHSYTDEELHTLWYSEREIVKMQRCCAKKIFQQMNRFYVSCTHDDTDHELRGIEHLQSCHIYKEARRKRKTIVREVLRIQEQQQMMNATNEKKLSSIYKLLSEQEMRKAIEFGKSDAKFAAKLYKEDG